jgi:hypothetical protein
MKIAWTILIISALTDFMISFGTALSAAMVVNQAVGMPGAPAILISALGGMIVASRTVQQALKATPVFTANLKGEDPPIIIPATTATRLAEARMAITPVKEPHEG